MCAQNSADDEPELLQHFIQMGATLEYDNPLHAAASSNKPRMLRSLLATGLNADKLNFYGGTALNLSLFYAPVFYLTLEHTRVF